MLKGRSILVGASYQKMSGRAISCRCKANGGMGEPGVDVTSVHGKKGRDREARGGCKDCEGQVCEGTRRCRGGQFPADAK
jgi:hypothetical protein